MPSFSPEYVAYIEQGQSLGHGTWPERCARYWRRPWGRKRCLICLRPRRRGFTELHHLTYLHLGDEWWWELRPLCRRPCHAIVTRLSRALPRRHGKQQRRILATYLVWLVARLPIVAAVAVAAVAL